MKATRHSRLLRGKIMSGFYGIYRYDGAPVDPVAGADEEAMAYYGPDGGGCTIAGPVSNGAPSAGSKSGRCL